MIDSNYSLAEVGKSPSFPCITLIRTNSGLKIAQHYLSAPTTSERRFSPHLVSWYCGKRNCLEHERPAWDEVKWCNKVFLGPFIIHRDVVNYRVNLT